MAGSCGRTKPRPHSWPTLMGHGSTTNGLTIGLGMKPIGHTDQDPQQGAELAPEPGCELGTPVRDDVVGEAMETEDVI